MGYGETNKCSECGYEFRASYGIGMLFSTVYKDTVDKAKKGELGEEVREFFEKNEDAAMDSEMIVLCCEECGHLENKKDLTLYILDEKKRDEAEIGCSYLGIPKHKRDCETHKDLVNCYIEVAKYPHKCEQCGGKMKILRKNDELFCPRCKIPLMKNGWFLWD